MATIVHNFPPEKSASKAYNSRLRSFNRINFPVNLESLARRVAAAGFRYLGYRDVVECDTCQDRLKDFEATDEPFVLHLRYFPECQFARSKVDPYMLRQAFETLYRSDSHKPEPARAAVGENDDS